MDEMSWQLELLKSSINITNLDIENRFVYFDFAYRPKPGGPRVWGKSMIKYQGSKFIEVAEQTKAAVLTLRKELEG